MSDKNDNQRAAGCVLGILALFVMLPMSFALWFGVLTAIEAPTWMWVVFWIHVPVTIVVSILRVMVEEILN